MEQDQRGMEPDHRGMEQPDSAAAGCRCVDPTRPVEVWPVLSRLLGEVAALFPDRYLHIGGDEVDLSCWLRSRSVQNAAAARGGPCRMPLFGLLPPPWPTPPRLLRRHVGWRLT